MLNLWWIKWDWVTIFLPVLRLYPASYIPPLLYTHLHLVNTLIRMTAGWSLKIFQKTTPFRKSKILDIKILLRGLYRSNDVAQLFTKRVLNGVTISYKTMYLLSATCFGPLFAVIRQLSQTKYLEKSHQDRGPFSTVNILRYIILYT
jgi:hypothetical protein